MQLKSWLTTDVHGGEISTKDKKFNLAYLFHLGVMFRLFAFSIHSIIFPINLYRSLGKTVRSTDMMYPFKDYYYYYYKGLGMFGTSFESFLSMLADLQVDDKTNTLPLFSEEYYSIILLTK